MIKYEMKNGGCFPRIFCDVCGKPITHCDEACVYWNDGAVVVLYAHNGACGRSCWGFTYWEMLNQFLLQLEHNVRLNGKTRKDAEATAKRLRSFGMDAVGEVMP